MPRAAAAQGDPLGPEFRVNTFTTGDQAYPSIAADSSSGNFVVVWNSGAAQDGYAYGVFAQRYASSGAPVGPEFRVNTYVTGSQARPCVAAATSGNFVVVWNSLGQDGSSYGVFGQRFDASGAPLGTEFRVNTYTTSHQRHPSVASDPAGNFVVVWENYIGGYFGYDIAAQRFASSGVPLGSEFRINTYTTGFDLNAAVASDASGNFVVVWNNIGEDGSEYGVFGQRFASSGVPLGSEFRVNTYTTSRQTYFSVAADPPGNFVVAWQSLGQDGSFFGVFGQRFATSGVPLGPEFRINTYTTFEQGAPSVAVDSAGNFVVVWFNIGYDAPSVGIFGQRFASSGSPLGPEFRVNTYTTDSPGYFLPDVAADSSGSFVVVWHRGDPQDGSGHGVFGQRYSQMVPVELMHFGIE